MGCNSFTSYAQEVILSLDHWVQNNPLKYFISDCEWSNFKRTTQEHPNTFWIFQLKQSDLTNKNCNIPYRSQSGARFVWMQKELIQKFHPHMLHMFLSRVSRRLFAAFLDYSSSLWVDTRLPRHTALSCGAWTEKNLRCHAALKFVSKKNLCPQGNCNKDSASLRVPGVPVIACTVATKTCHNPATSKSLRCQAGGKRSMTCRTPTSYDTTAASQYSLENHGKYIADTSIGTSFQFHFTRTLLFKFFMNEPAIDKKIGMRRRSSKKSGKEPWMRWKALVKVSTRIPQKNKQKERNTQNKIGNQPFLFPKPKTNAFKVIPNKNLIPFGFAQSLYGFKLHGFEEVPLSLIPTDSPHRWVQNIQPLDRLPSHGRPVSFRRNFPILGGSMGPF